VTKTLQRIFSLSGVLPLGLFLTAHLGVCGAALFGRDVFVGTVTRVDQAPLLHVLEVLFIYLPLAVHGGLGAWMVVTRQALPSRPYSRALGRALRASGIVALAFIAWHAWALRVRGSGSGAAEYYSRLAETLSSTWWTASASPEWRGVPFVALAYLVGVAATVFHFAVGLWGFGVSWRGARAGLACAALGTVLVLLGANTVVCFATGSRYFARGSFTPVELEPKTAPCPPQ
jgi:succinate dehydrogenase / fumarate reductase cytochrome b subunit